MPAKTNIKGLFGYVFFLISCCAHAETANDLLAEIELNEMQHYELFSASKTVGFNQTASGSTDATSVVQLQLAYFSSTNCSGTALGNGITSTGTSHPYNITLNTPFGLVATSAYNFGSSRANISPMSQVQSIAIYLLSTSSAVPQANFSGNSYVCVAVDCSSGSDVV